MPEKTPGDRGQMLVDALIASRSGSSSPDPAHGGHRRRARGPDRPPPRRGVALREHPPGVLRRSAPPRRLARRPGAQGRTLAGYLAELHEQGRAPSNASTAVAAARFRARLAGAPSPARERTARVLAGYRRTAGERGRGQARPFGAADLAAGLASCHRRRRRCRGVESDEVVLKRGCLDAVIAGLLFMAGLRRSEVSALRWVDKSPSLPPATGCW